MGHPARPDRPPHNSTTLLVASCTGSTARSCTLFICACTWEPHVSHRKRWSAGQQVPLPIPPAAGDCVVAKFEAQERTLHAEVGGRVVELAAVDEDRSRDRLHVRRPRPLHLDLRRFVPGRDHGEPAATPCRTDAVGVHVTVGRETVELEGVGRLVATVRSVGGSATPWPCSSWTSRSRRSGRGPRSVHG